MVDPEGLFGLLMARTMEVPFSYRYLLKMSTPERFELRAENKVWATLVVYPDRNILEHSLTDLQVVMCPGFAAYDSAGQPLTITQGGGHIYLGETNGLRRLTLQTTTDEDIAIADVTDPKEQVQLVLKLAGIGSLAAR